MSDQTAGTKWDAGLHVAALVALSVAFEAIFIHRGLNAMDEGWPLYAARRLHAGGQLYRDVFWVFPPGHVWAAWVAYALDPPGLALARIFYAAFSVALCVALYFLGRRITTPGFALLGGALVAVAAPDSHSAQLVFGYRYLVWSALALWCFSERVRTGSPRWMAAAGAAVGVALVFRIDPPVAATAGIALGTLSLRSGWRVLLRDGLAFTAGFALVVAPLLVWFVARVGAQTLWLEVVVRPIEMHRLQGQPMPPLEAPEHWNPWNVRKSFVAVQFRLWLLLFAAYSALLAAQLARSIRRGRPFAQPVLLAVVAWGFLFYFRSMWGRSDEPHLDSAVPPALLLLAHAVGTAGSRLRAPTTRVALGAAVLAAWVLLTAVPHYPSMLRRGAVPARTLGGATLYHRQGSKWDVFDELVDAVRRETAPGDVILDLSASPLFYVAADRSGPGFADLVMPGTFLSEGEELAQLERLKRAPPALVIASKHPFDRDEKRGLLETAPRIRAWVLEHYEVRGEGKHFLVLAPRSGGVPAPPEPALDTED